jgi:hypothetical protein
VQWFWRLIGRVPCIRRQVIVNFTDGRTAIRGVLFGESGSWLTLKQAAMLSQTTAAVPMDGDVVVHRSQVLFLQVV